MGRFIRNGIATDDSFAYKLLYLGCLQSSRYKIYSVMISALYKFRKIKRRRFYDTGNIIDLQKETNYIHVALQLHIAFSFFLI